MISLAKPGNAFDKKVKCFKCQKGTIFEGMFYKKTGRKIPIKQHTVNNAWGVWAIL